MAPGGRNAMATLMEQLRTVRPLALGAALAAGASFAQAQGVLAELKWADSGMSAVQGGVLRCDPGQDFQLSLQGEDASMQRVPLEMYAPEVESSDPAVARAAVSSSSAHIVNVRCTGDGEAWLTAETMGKRAHFGVLVGSAKGRATLRQPTPGSGSQPLLAGAREPLRAMAPESAIQAQASRQQASTIAGELSAVQARARGPARVNEAQAGEPTAQPVVAENMTAQNTVTATAAPVAHYVMKKGSALTFDFRPGMSFVDWEGRSWKVWGKYAGASWDTRNDCLAINETRNVGAGPKEDVLTLQDLGCKPGDYRIYLRAYLSPPYGEPPAPEGYYPKPWFMGPMVMLGETLEEAAADAGYYGGTAEGWLMRGDMIIRIVPDIHPLPHHLKAGAQPKVLKRD